MGPFKSLRFHLSTPKTRHFQNDTFSKTSTFETVLESFRFNQCSVDDRPKRIKTFAALTENALVWMAPQTTSCPSFSSAMVERANYACTCEKRYPRGKVIRARREGGKRVTLSPSPCFLHPYLLIGMRGK